MWQNGRRATCPLSIGVPTSSPARAAPSAACSRNFSGLPGKKFDFIDLSYDAVRDDSGRFRRVVTRTARGVGAFGARPDYFVTNTVLKCDFLITVPVMKTHLQCGITACFKNYVGTAPRQA